MYVCPSGKQCIFLTAIFHNSAQFRIVNCTNSETWLIFKKKTVSGDLPTKCLSPKIAHWSPAPQCDGVWRWTLREVIRARWGYKDGALRIGALVWRDKRERFPVCPHTHWGKAVCKPGRGPCEELTMAVPWSQTSAPKTTQNKFLLRKPPSLGTWLWHVETSPKATQLLNLADKKWIIRLKNMFIMRWEISAEKWNYWKGQIESPELKKYSTWSRKFTGWHWQQIGNYSRKIYRTCK